MTDKTSEAEPAIQSNEEIVNELTSEFEKLQKADDCIDEENQKQKEENLSEAEKTANKEEADKLKQQGNTEFKSGNYSQSLSLYTSALQLCPLKYTCERAILYSNRAASKLKLPDYDKSSALDDCTKAIELNPEYLKALNRRAKLYEEMDKLDESLEDFKRVQLLDPSNAQVTHAILALNRKIEKRNEEMKTEMVGKLKDLGNLFLKPFGLSTDNFQLNQDPNSGGYSVNFVQKK